MYPVDDAVSPVPPGTVDLTRGLKWTSLTKICFKLNNITSIDTSLVTIYTHIELASERKQFNISCLFCVYLEHYSLCSARQSHHM